MDCSLSWLAILRICTTATLLVSPGYRLCHAMKSNMVTCVYLVLRLSHRRFVLCLSLMPAVTYVAIFDVLGLG